MRLVGQVSVTECDEFIDNLVTEYRFISVPEEYFNGAVIYLTPQRYILSTSNLPASCIFVPKTRRDNGSHFDHTGEGDSKVDNIGEFRFSI